jgi:AbiV family abortive infection protein
MLMLIALRALLLVVETAPTRSRATRCTTATLTESLSLERTLAADIPARVSSTIFASRSFICTYYALYGSCCTYISNGRLNWTISASLTKLADSQTPRCQPPYGRVLRVWEPRGMHTGAMAWRKLPDLMPSQVGELQDALLANADRLLDAASGVARTGNGGLARSLAILAMEESGKAIAIHQRRVAMAYAPEGEPFVDVQLERLWSSHTAKLDLVHRFLTEEPYWFGVEPADPVANARYLGAIKGWIRRHDRLKQRGFYVDVGRRGSVLAPADAADGDSLADVIAHVHQIGWQLRLGEHIEAKLQAREERGVLPSSESEIAAALDLLGAVGEDEALVYRIVKMMRLGRPGKALKNAHYRLRLPEPGVDRFARLGTSGHEAETLELRRLAHEIGLEGSQ